MIPLPYRKPPSLWIILYQRAADACTVTSGRRGDARPPGCLQQPLVVGCIGIVARPGGAGASRVDPRRAPAACTPEAATVSVDSQKEVL